ncbi:hypothetical protein [Nocardia niwae]|uniref:Uncharacterized protein n=1 Tax=Nocardia niwae TaxID=626084 RepID=A0ABV2XG78_9NOCA
MRQTNPAVDSTPAPAHASETDGAPPPEPTRQTDGCEAIDRQAGGIDRTWLPDDSAATPLIGAAASPIMPADPPAVPRPTINPDDPVPAPRMDAAERSASAPEADADPHFIAHTTASRPAAGDAALSDATDEPVSRRRTDTSPGSTAAPWIDALRFSWLDASPDPQLGPPGTETTDDTAQAGSDPRTGKTGGFPQPSGTTGWFEASRKTGTASPAIGPLGESAPLPQPGPTDAALGRRPDAQGRPKPIDDAPTAHRSAQQRVAADNSDPLGTAQNPAPRTAVAHPRPSVPPTTGSANPVRQTDPAPPQQTHGTRGASAQRPDSASAQKHGRAPIERNSPAQRPTVTERTGAPDPSEALRIAREMSARHGLEVVGFETATVDIQVIREIASALDELLTKYPMPLRGVELTDDAQARPRPDRTPTAEQSAIWIVLDRAALTPPAPVETRRVFRRRGPAERPVYTAVAREFAGALDAAGGFRARQEALRTLINESLRGGGGGLGLLDPGRALIDGFTEVVLRGERAGAPAKELHGALVKMARAESSDGLSA